MMSIVNMTKGGVPVGTNRSGLASRATAVAIICAGALQATPAAAQGQTAGTEEYEGLESIIVTSRRIEQDLQRTPLSVVAVGADELASMNLDSFQSLEAFIPNLSIGGQNGYGTAIANFSIRGIGGGQGYITDDNSVGVYVDDVYFARPNGALLDLIDVERIEVLRGPQGTLFGQNTSGGAVRYITKKPEQTFNGSLTGVIGNLERRDLLVTFNVPLSDKVFVRVAGTTKEHDGYVTRLIDGQKTGDQDVKAGRVQLRWVPNERFDVNLSVDASRSSDHGSATDVPIIDPTDLAPRQLGNPGYSENLVTPSRWTVQGGDPERGRFESVGATATVVYAINDNLTFKSLSGYRTSDQYLLQDWDRTPYPVWAQESNTEIEYYTQEFQLSGDSFDGRLKWLTGLFYLREMSVDLKFRNTALEPPNTIELRDIDVESYAAFAQGTYQLTGRLSATVGARYSKDEKDYFGVRGPFSGSNSGSWSSFTPRVGLEFQWTDDVMVYVSAAKGTRAGGFNSRPRPGQLFNGIIPYAPEELWSYETGVRSEFFSRRMRLNATYFYMDYEGMQVNTTFVDPLLNLGVNITQNAGAAEVQGIELDMQALVAERLRLGASFGWIDAKYTDVGDSPTLTLDTPFQRTPEFSYTLNASWTQPLPSRGEFVFRADYGWKDEQESNNTPSNSVTMPAYGLLNGRVEFRTQDGRWNVALYGKNLLDEEYLISAFDPSTRENFMGFVMHDIGRPREYGVEVRFQL